ncbi:MarR family transcriptional regulator [Luteibacter yeojuensis]|uniref:MarR family transcriptional regulator n=2 Tax=Luteibacter yeojuensis TaxID=345309 RepID=A0A0F3K5E2_9GAMM|nr:MarR family transcriptional regulator [Luteibacter yeojuensis]
MFEEVSLGAPQHAPGFVMWRVVHRYQRAMDAALRDLDLTHLQFVTLALVAWLGREGGAGTQADIARMGDIHPMQVSLMLKALQAKGMVHRQTAKGAGPAKQVHVTAAGLKALRGAMPRAIDVQRTLFGPAGLPGGELLRMLNAIDAEA